MRPVHLAQLVVGVCAGLLLGGMVTASAAQLGNLTAQTLGTSATVIASCDTSIAASWDDGATSPVWVGNGTTPANSTYNVTKLHLTGIAAGCSGQSYKAVVAGSTGAPIQSFSGTISATSLTLTLTATTSKNIEQIIIVIYE